jgi:3-oxoacyl-(acyl-carrier-protein) synthase/SAM-dependent methyltransferase
LLLEVSWEALEHACQPPDRLNNSATGVFVGLSTNDYAQLQLKNVDPASIDTYFGTGGAHSVVVGRLSYLLGLRGPSIAIDTACSSSLVAIHLACQSLRMRECRMALAGGVNAILLPELTIALSKARMMAADGRCKTFDAAADGFVRAEGCGIVVLKRLADALTDGDTVLAVIRGSAVNQDGRSSGLTAPNGPSQTAVIEAALANAAIEPCEIQYVEAHGTGTSLGDPIEVQALAAALSRGRPPGGQFVVGSVKTNLGHMEAAAGVGGLIKVVLSLQHDEIPAHLHLRTLSPHIPWSQIPAIVPTKAMPWHRGAQPRRAGVSSFGFGGTNAHVIVEEAPTTASFTGNPAGAFGVLTLSAKTPEALRALAAAYVEALSQAETNFADVCFSANTGRAVFEHRLALVATCAAEAGEILASFAKSGDASGLLNPSEVSSAPGSAAAQLLARQFIEGVAVPWDEVYRDQPRRKISLPTYPFQRERYWYEAAKPTRVAVGSAARWAHLVVAGECESSVGPLDLRLDTYAARWASLDRLTVEHMLSTLRALKAFAGPADAYTVEELIAHCGIIPSYRRLIKRWLSRLEAEQVVLRRADDRYVSPGGLRPPRIEEAWQDARQENSDLPALLAYLERCGRLLVPVLTGSENPLETIFPGGDFNTAEFLYERWALPRYFNGIVRAVAEAAALSAPQGGPLLVLEVGAGTGGTTSAVLPVLMPDHTTYVFTDMSEAFLARASRKFASYPFVQYGLLNIEQCPAGQGYRPGTFDLILAANCVHATKDLLASLAHIRSLLAPGGILLLYEVTNHLAWFEMSVGLIEGWGRFEDGIRGEDPLLKPDQWKRALMQAGFCAAESFPRMGAQAEVLGHHILMAQVPGEGGSGSVCGADFPNVAKSEEIRSVNPKDEGSQSLLGQLKDANEEERVDILVGYVRQHVGDVLRLPKGKSVDRRQRLMDLGVDSLMAVELRNRLGQRLHLSRPLPATLMFDYPTIEAIAQFLAREVTTEQPVSGPSSRAREVADLSDDEVELMLLRKLGSK